MKKIKKILSLLLLISIITAQTNISVFAETNFSTNTNTIIGTNDDIIIEGQKYTVNEFVEYLN